MMRKHLLVFLLCFWTSFMLYAQDQTISGKVTDTNGEGLPGVNIQVKGTSKGTVSDMEGNYRLSAASDETLVFQFVGYESLEIPVNGRTTINATLKDSSKELDEVVITGLASSVKRSNLANAVSTISAKELVGVTNPSTFDGALYGKLTGANITQSSGAPGGGIAIRLRGVSSIVGQNQPLFIVDGVYMDNSEIPSGLRNASGANSGSEENASNRMADLDPNDIESVEILKGASAAAIYGSRANAGVIIVTTKKGKGGGTKIDFAQDFGASTAIRLMGMRNFTEESVLASYNEAERQAFVAARNAGKIYDYEKEIYGNTGLISNSRINITGGNDKTRFYIGGSHRTEEGIIKRTGYQRSSLRLNIDHKVSDFFNISTNSNFVYSSADRGFTGNENEGGLSHGYNLAFSRPWANLFPDAQGNYPDNPYASGNPLMVRDLADNNETTYRTIQGVNFDLNLLRRENAFLKFSALGGIDYFANETFVYVPGTHQAQRGVNNGFLGIGRNKILNANWQGIFVFNTSAMDKTLDLTTQAGFTSIYKERDLVYTQATQLVPGQKNLTQAGAQSMTQTIQSEQDFGYFVQQEANYKDQIIATAGVRLDKSTLNGDPNKLYAFPKASIAFNIAKFDFWTIKAISQFKLRAAYGETGSSAAFGSTFTGFNSNNITGRGGSVIGTQRGSTKLEPERAGEFEVGVDLGFLQNRFTVEASYYNRNVTNLILERSMPASSGFSSEVGNFADLVNRGLELALNANVIEKPAIRWTTTLNFWFNRSEVTRLDVPAFAPAGSAFGVGLGSFFVEKGATITQIKARNSQNQVIKVGDTEPNFQMGWSNNITLFENFDLSFLWHWKNGGNNLNLSLFLTDLGRTSHDYDSQTGIDRRARPNGVRFIEDASYIRLREVALYYRVPTKVFEGIKAIKGLKVGVSGYNVLTFTNYNWYDPEVSTKGGAGLSSGIDVTPFPSSKRIFFHITANF